VLGGVSEEFVERRDPAAVAFIAHWIAALVDEPAQLSGPHSGRLERQPWGAANSDEALAAVNTIQKNERVRTIRVDAHA
jgi:hypothetical protein